MMEVARQFGRNLRHVRSGVGISQEELGQRCSLHRTEIGLLERGARVPRVDTLIKIATGLGVRIDCALLDGITWEPNTTIPTGSFVITAPAPHEQHRGPTGEADAHQAEGSEAANVAAEGRERPRELKEK
jgi:transcriptional regulator with XRE-family HTH domain